MAERALLLGLMRRLRRRRRWVDAVTGAALGVALGAPAIAALIPLLRARGIELGGVAVAGALAVAALGGALVRGLRRISLPVCAHAVDRALGSAEAGNRVFAAVSFAESGTAASPFVAAITADAWTRARAVPARRIVPSPPARPLVLAAVGLAAVVALLLGPRLSSVASTGHNGADGRAASVEARALRHKTLLRLGPAALDAEREDVVMARAAAGAAQDAELARLANEMARLLSELSGPGVDSESAVRRARELAASAHDAAGEARVAKAAAKAGQSALASAGRGSGVRADVMALSEAMANSRAGAPEEAATRLAGGGEAGRAALAQAAAAAAAALARGGSENAGGDNSDSTGDDEGTTPAEDEPSRRRLEDESAPQTSGPAGAGAPRSNYQRRLQHLRRDLERSAADCQRDPEACRRRAGNAGRSLDQLGRAGRSAEARTRLAQTAQQLLDRLQRGGGGGSDARRMRSFSRAARGNQARPGAGAVGAPHPGGGDPASRPDGDDAEAAMAIDDSGGGSDGDGAGDTGNQAHGEGDGDGENAGKATSPQRSDQGAGAASAGSGVGSSPGGPVLGTRTPGGGGAGRDAPTAVASKSSGPSRSAIIGGAATRGFASADYRNVFTDYAATVEESLDSAAVPPGRRYLVRRYFQLIRPRGP